MPAASPQPDRITDPHTCIDCGYDLRGLEPAGVCPECGAAIERSVQKGRLRYEDPQWLRRVSRGGRLWDAGSLGLWAPYAALALLLLTAMILERTGVPAADHPVARTLGIGLVAIALAIFVASAIATLAGTFIIGGATPSRGAGVLGVWRHALRWVPMGFCAALAIWYVFLDPRLRQVGPEVGWLWLAGFQAVAAACVLAQGVVIRRFAFRLPEHFSRTRPNPRHALNYAIGAVACMAGYDLYVATSDSLLTSLNLVGYVTTLITWMFTAGMGGAIGGIVRGISSELAAGEPRVREAPSKP